MKIQAGNQTRQNTYIFLLSVSERRLIPARMAVDVEVLPKGLEFGGLAGSLLSADLDGVEVE